MALKGSLEVVLVDRADEVLELAVGVDQDRGCGDLVDVADLEADDPVLDVVDDPDAVPGSDLAGALEYLGRMLTQKAIVFVVSDFLSPNLERPLKLLAQRHDVVACTVEDPSETVLPDVGLARMVDPESGTSLFIDTSDPRVREQFARASAEEREQIASTCSSEARASLSRS